MFLKQFKPKISRQYCRVRVSRHQQSFDTKIKTIELFRLVFIPSNWSTRWHEVTCVKEKTVEHRFRDCLEFQSYDINCHTKPFANLIDKKAAIKGKTLWFWYVFGIFCICIIYNKRYFNIFTIRAWSDYLEILVPV